MATKIIQIEEGSPIQRDGLTIENEGGRIRITHEGETGNPMSDLLSNEVGVGGPGAEENVIYQAS